WRTYGLSTYSHNTVLVDGLPQNRERGFASEPLTDVTWVTSENYDYAIGVYDELYGESASVTHKRHVLFVKPDIFLVWDVLTSKDHASHNYQARWHVTTPNTAVDGAGIMSR
ncbi:MAG: heparinase, partial [Candidatus Latescibacteria bacterium]|nr:heparinase [Candidatus Latescibacterota bacterium]